MNNGKHDEKDDNTALRLILPHPPFVLQGVSSLTDEKTTTKIGRYAQATNVGLSLGFFSLRDERPMYGSDFTQSRSHYGRYGHAKHVRAFSKRTKSRRVRAKVLHSPNFRLARSHVQSVIPLFDGEC